MERNLVPPGLAVEAKDWSEEDYPASEVIPYGKKRSQELEIALTPEVWWPRAVLWAQALHTLRLIMVEYSSEEEYE